MDIISILSTMVFAQAQVSISYGRIMSVIFIAIGMHTKLMFDYSCYLAL